MCIRVTIGEHHVRASALGNPAYACDLVAEHQFECDILQILLFCLQIYVAHANKQI